MPLVLQESAFELHHVGRSNYSVFFRAQNVLEALAGEKLDMGILGIDRWLGGPRVQRVQKPVLPSLARLATGAEPYFIAEDAHKFGPYYDRALMALEQRFREG